MIQCIEDVSRGYNNCNPYYYSTFCSVRLSSYWPCSRKIELCKHMERVLRIDMGRLSAAVVSGLLEIPNHMRVKHVTFKTMRNPVDMQNVLLDNWDYFCRTWTNTLEAFCENDEVEPRNDTSRTNKMSPTNAHVKKDLKELWATAIVVMKSLSSRYTFSICILNGAAQFPYRNLQRNRRHLTVATLNRIPPVPVPKRWAR